MSDNYRTKETDDCFEILSSLALRRGPDVAKDVALAANILLTASSFYALGARHESAMRQTTGVEKERVEKQAKEQLTSLITNIQKLVASYFNDRDGGALKEEMIDVMGLVLDRINESVACFYFKTGEGTDYSA